MDSLIKMICGGQISPGVRCRNHLVYLDISATNIKREGFIKLMSSIDTSNLVTLKLSRLVLI